MKRRLVSLTLAFLGAVAMAVIPAAPAHAAGETLQCLVAPMNPPVFTSNGCRSTKPSSWYKGAFALSHGPGSYTYSWNTGGWQVAAGCTSTSDICHIQIPSTQDDTYATVTLTYYLNGQLEGSLTATAYVLATCWYEGRWFWC